jgi:hypothetical protein
VPEASPSGQWFWAPSARTVLAYGRDVAVPSATSTLVHAVVTVLPIGSLTVSR